MSRADFKDIVPPLTEARIARQYAAVAARAPAARARGMGGRWLVWAVAAGMTVAIAGATLHAMQARTAGAIEGAVIESGATAAGQPPTSVTLADGSRIELGATTRARLTSARSTSIRIDLERGTLEVEATHVEGRTFVVGAGAYEVRVVGTHFSVRREAGEEVSVHVDRGVVEVAASTGGGEVRRLAAGERWSAPDGAMAMRATAASAPPASAAPLPVTAPSGSPPVAATASPVANLTAPRHDESARDLFDEAQRARAEGRSSDAARAFDRLRRGFPRDPRAALSAFELGRLRLDVLGDPQGAEEALRDAMALGPSSPFREDAEARRVEALARMGDAGACAAARTAYLARWPNGTYRRAVEAGCGDR
jgi:transmembrane sensor